MEKKWIALIAVGILLIVGLATFSSFNDVQQEGVRRETALSAQYLDNQNELSTLLSGARDLLGVANRSTDAIDRVLTDALKGRYDGNTSARPGGGSFFSAISEAYPNIDKVAGMYERLADYISAHREAYKDKQTKLLDMLRSYDTWREAGLIHSWQVRAMGFPGNTLRAQIGTTFVRGQAAEDQMYVIVLTSDTHTAYKTGEMPQAIT